MCSWPGRIVGDLQTHSSPVARVEEAQAVFKGEAEVIYSARDVPFELLAVPSGYTSNIAGPRGIVSTPRAKPPE